MSNAPTRRQLHAAAERSLLAAALFGAAAMLASRNGYAGQVWPYVAMAVAVLPQAFLALVARVGSARHVDVRVSRRPIWVNGLVGVVLAGAALVILVRDGLGVPEGWSAALGAVAGLLAAVPPVLVAPRRRSTTRTRAAEDLALAARPDGS
jgi:hypothetical protein